MSNANYILAAHKSDLLKTQDRIADMVANQNTTGFKAEKNSFKELVAKTEDNKKISFSKISGTTIDTSQGSIISTGRQLDIAINGKGFFMVETPMGPRYTRAGNLAINPEGALVTKEGYPLVGPGGGNVELAEGDSGIVIRENGLVTTEAGEDRGQIGIFNFNNPQLLERVGKGMYKSPEDAQVADDTAKIVQGVLEGSNVNPVSSMADLIKVSRAIDNIKNIEKQINDIKLTAIQKLADN